MAHTFGSLRFSTCGRRRKALPRSRKRVISFKPYEESDTYRRDVPKYQSASDIGGDCSVTDRSYAKDANFTVAPAYNKGAYQVISKENIQDIGR